MREQRDGTMIKNTHCSCRGPKFCYQHPCQVAHNHPQLQFWGIWRPLLASLSTYTYMHPTSSQVHTHTHNKETKNEIFKNTLCACGFVVLSRVLVSVLESSFSPDPDIIMMMMMLRRGRRRRSIVPHPGHATGKKTEDKRRKPGSPGCAPSHCPAARDERNP